jgi:ribose-phosphate pyrophosphokinase
MLLNPKRDNVADYKLFCGNASVELANKVASQLNISLSEALITTFSDGETNVEILENVRGQSVFVIQSTCAPSNDNLMELVLMGDALRRASATSVTAIVPYFGYARQDRRVRSRRVPITAKIVADMLHSVGFTSVITVDLHADQIQGFFDMPVDNIYASPDVIEDLKPTWTDHYMIVSPDVGGVVRARAISKRLGNSDLAIIDKRRPGPNQAEVMHLIGDVKDKHCVIVDDIVDTAGTLSQAADALIQFGAKSVKAYCTHAVLSGKAIENINNSVLEQVVVSDSIALGDKLNNCPKLRVLSLDSIIAETITRIDNRESVSSMFTE